ncbi:MAG: hypothetical protein A2499_16310 [Stygiobacter sp. RIFOXYC12_FULL_38_8]|nr:MAG: hypothetical protein A2299_03570 [Stygiobacter sp. RIFOXYB2_FULL_37_11]OGV10711.1 MAG: hypothetical protein A2237_10375 [Stygiobacter sp. RIFOXYA2_FULL_38_8]OGV12459.1 MAG: hypothetical protein A2440_14485 [Stygiobacter sp. RIFOXYC2_FULL_38_25]OGV24088.1 MAG: hypothetical protein A2499_16310 [Stygiobacter sp. RIFOXYC12_FULL_38_8]OGV78722.1 MAG: hypothetical protein A2X65_08650 [Stygiobacter sp. GWF2_38_21]
MLVLKLINSCENKMKLVFKNFSFPYRKQAMFASIILILSITYLKTFWHFYPIFALIFFTLLMSYSFLGNYKLLDKMDELQKLIQLERGYLLSQFIPLIIFVVFLINQYYQISIDLTIVFILFAVIVQSAQQYLKKKYS